MSERAKVATTWSAAWALDALATATVAPTKTGCPALPWPSASSRRDDVRPEKPSFAPLYAASPDSGALRRLRSALSDRGDCSCDPASRGRTSGPALEGLSVGAHAGRRRVFCDAMEGPDRARCGGLIPGPEDRLESFPADRDALGDRGAPLEHPPERGVAPPRRYIDEQVMVAVAVDHPRQRGERQVEAIGRMHEQHRVARRRLDGPEAVELIKKRCSSHSGVPVTCAG